MRCFACLFTIIILISCDIDNNSQLNLGFEIIEKDNPIPSSWDYYGNTDVMIDSSVVLKGKYSVKIQGGSKENDFGSLLKEIDYVEGTEKIELTGSIKTNNNDKGFAGLMLRIDKGNETLAFENMSNEEINGNTNWNKYSIVLDLPKDFDKIYFGVLLSGEGVAWFDDLNLKIDNKKYIDKSIIQKKEKLINDNQFDDEGSIKNINATTQVINDLELLGKVWGFVKYYHPTISKGDINWDYEFLRFLPEYLYRKPSETSHLKIEEWLSKFHYKEDKKVKIDHSGAYGSKSNMSLDFDWIEIMPNDSKLRKKLLRIYANRNISSNKYVTIANAGNAIFNEEDIYKKTFPDASYRILAVIRYWNAVNYFYPYKHLTKLAWKDVLKKYLHKLINTNNALEYRLNMLELVSEINDTHAQLYVGSTKFNFNNGSLFSKYKVKFINKDLIVEDFYIKESLHSLKRGDVIQTIDDVDVSEYLINYSKYYPSSNKLSLYRKVANNILRSNNKKMNLKVLRGSRILNIEIDMFSEDDLDFIWYDWDGEKSYKLISKEVLYLDINFFTKNDIPNIEKLIPNTNRVIVDCRGYPYEPFIYELAGLFSSKKTPFVRFSKPNISNIGEFNFSKIQHLEASQNTYNKEIVILMDRDTQSQSETLCLALNALPKSVTIGEGTAGANGNVSYLQLPGGLKTRFSGIGVYYPDFRETQGVGIIPDFKVKLSKAKISNKEDEILQAALRFSFD